MRLSKDQKNLLKGSLAGWAGMMVLITIFDRRSWSDTLWLILGSIIAQIIVGALLVFGSRVPKNKDENQ